MLDARNGAGLLAIIIRVTSEKIIKCGNIWGILMEGLGVLQREKCTR
jgi:hypothetical protein